jgi:hypothetical protein
MPLSFCDANILKHLCCRHSGIHFAKTAQFGKPGVGRSADAARMSTCATMGSTLSRASQKLNGIGLKPAPLGIADTRRRTLPEQRTSEICRLAAAVTPAAS